MSKNFRAAANIAVLAYRCWALRRAVISSCCSSIYSSYPHSSESYGIIRQCIRLLPSTNSILHKNLSTSFIHKHSIMDIDTSAATKSNASGDAGGASNTDVLTAAAAATIASSTFTEIAEGNKISELFIPSVSLLHVAAYLGQASMLYDVKEKVFYNKVQVH